MLKILPLLLLATLAPLATAQSPSPPPGVRIPEIAGGFPPPQHLEGVPPFHEQSLRLEKIPAPTGPRVSLFNGKDLDNFTPWLGYANGSMFPASANDKPLGETGIGEIFTVVSEESAPAIYISGKVWGSLNTKLEYGNYHLSLRYKFRKQWGAEPPNTGVLYHSYGPNGAFAGTWMSSIEFEIKQGLTGMVALIGRDITAVVDLGKGPGPGLFGLDDMRFMPGGKHAQIRLPTMVRQQRDVELPVGQWNQVDLYVADDNAVQVINGMPTMSLSHISLVGSDGKAHPLTRGKIQLESEGTEVFMRNIYLEPIKSVPQVTADR